MKGFIKNIKTLSVDIVTHVKRHRIKWNFYDTHGNNTFLSNGDLLLRVSSFFLVLLQFITYFLFYFVYLSHFCAYRIYFFHISLSRVWYIFSILFCFLVHTIRMILWHLIYYRYHLSHRRKYNYVTGIRFYLYSTL